MAGVIALLYSPRMKTPAAPSTPSCTAIATTIVCHTAVWTLICGVGALGSYRDYAGAATHGYGHFLLRWLLYHVPMIMLGSGLSLALNRWPALFDSARRSALVYVALLLFFLPLEWLYVAFCDVVLRGAGVSLEVVGSAFMALQMFNRFTEFAWMSGTLLAMAAIGNWRLAREREAGWRRAQSANLALQLALEQQRMLALRAQLEPHFIFNALNAISALVRTGDGPLALSGIARLSDLLRYALAAGAREMVTIGEELQFVHDYLSLQKLRYGERLRFTIEGDCETVRHGDCPPLLLQPLIENALRHDLDSHDGEGDIRLSFEVLGNDVLIRVSNPVQPHATPNPGAGLGLQNTRERLQSSSKQASLQTQRANGRFLVEIRMPLQAA
ncbi:sensor histidine kinase [Janthinobacterium sp. Mn2066]|uniref:sensor histidine kinase n=1 Tax=Janthinobacterium sp. Mn2066 TaxID=3395264 RepID=UPI003BECF1B2